MPVALPELLLVGQEEKDTLLLTEALEPPDSDAVGLLLTVLLPLRVVEGVGAAVPVLLLL